MTALIVILTSRAHVTCYALLLQPRGRIYSYQVEFSFVTYFILFFLVLAGQLSIVAQNGERNQLPRVIGERDYSFFHEPGWEVEEFWLVGGKG